jgi:nucleoid-associated protein YgaU
MDTLSHDSSSSSPIATYVAIGAGILGVILSGTALFKLSALQKTVAEHAAELPKIATLEGDLRTAATKNENDNRALREGVQNALNQLGDQIGALRGQVTKIEEAQKARAAAPAGKGGAAAPTGVLNADGSYSVAPGDTLAKIARKFAVKVDAIEAENPGLDPARLKVGQKIKIPKK